jgi:hypothetical protein
MSHLSIIKPVRRTAQVIAALFAVAALACFVFGSALEAADSKKKAVTDKEQTTAPPPAPTPRGKCEKWFNEEIDATQKCDIAEGFNKVLNDSALTSAYGKKLRQDLLTTTANYSTPRKRVEEIVNSVIATKPGHKKVKFPPGSLFVFYVPEKPEPSPSPSPAVAPSPCGGGWYPNDHCLHVFYLPEVGQTSKALWEASLKCCYEPWIEVLMTCSSGAGPK